MIVFAMVTPLMAKNDNPVKFTFHGDMNHRFMLHTNHLDWFKGLRPEALNHGNVEDSYAEVKYRLWTEATTNDGNIKGVYAIEMGGLRFGATGSLGKGTGGTYSGDSVNIETRWAYIDFQVPGVKNKSRIKIGLQPFKLNSKLWSETILGVNYTEKIGFFQYQLSWMRGYDEKNWYNTDESDPLVPKFDDIDFLSARYDVKFFDKKFNAAIFGLYGFNDDAGENVSGTIKASKYQVKKFPKNTGLRLWCVGTDGGFSISLPALGNVKIFTAWDTIFQLGKIKNAHFYDDIINPDKNVETYVYKDENGKEQTQKYHAEGDFYIYSFSSHLKAGLDAGRMKLTYTGWYTSGDRDITDDTFNGYMSIDMHAGDSIVLFEGCYADDTVFTNAHYLLDKGFIMNKLAVDLKVTDIFDFGVSGLYMRTSKPMEYNDPKSDDVLYSVHHIGYEVDTYAKFQLYSNLEFAINGGYLFSGNAMDVFEDHDIRNGYADEDIYIVASRLRYKF